MNPSKRAKKIRKAGEFSLARLAGDLQTPKTGQSSVFSWSLADIKAARDDQMRGNFARPARLAESMRTDDALAVAYENRLAPQRCLPVEIVPANDSSRAQTVAKEAEGLFGENGVGIHPDSLSDIHGCLVNHGVAFGVIVATPREDGSRVDVELRSWPIEWVRWDEFARCFKTRVDPETTQPGDVNANADATATSAYEVPIVHGDGRWVVFKKHEHRPWTQEAAVVPAALVWARHAYAVRDWAKGSVAHGSAKALASMPEGMPLQDADGTPTEEAQAMLDLLRAIASDDAPVGIKPAGSTVEFLTNQSTAWQVFAELVQNAEKAAARIYLGTDGVLGSQGGAPGIDIQALFGVAATRVEGDLTCIERAILTGVIEPWCALNFGDSTLAPQRRYVRPDGDEEAREKHAAAQNQAYYDALAAAKTVGAQVTQEFVNELAADYGVRAPKLAPLVTAPAATSPATAPSTTPLRRVAPTDRPFAERNAAFLADLTDYRANNLELTQKRIEELAALHGVPAPRLAKGT